MVSLLNRNDWEVFYKSSGSKLKSATYALPPGSQFFFFLRIVVNDVCSQLQLQSQPARCVQVDDLQALAVISTCKRKVRRNATDRRLLGAV